MSSVQQDTATKIVRDVIQRVYGDATQSDLDFRAAEEILRALQEAGWASLEDVAMLISAAGGEIEVTYDMKILRPWSGLRVERHDDPATGTTSVRIRP